jgi:hypothetical protein
LSRYSYRAALALAHSVSRAALTWMRACSKILTLSSYARSSSTAVAAGDTAAGPEDRGGIGLRKAYRRKSATHQVTFQPTARDDRKLTFPKHASSEHLPPSSSKAAVNHHCDWSPYHGDVFHGHCHEPSFTNQEGLERRAWGRQREVLLFLC